MEEVNFLTQNRGTHAITWFMRYSLHLYGTAWSEQRNIVDKTVYLHAVAVGINGSVSSDKHTFSFNISNRLFFRSGRGLIVKTGNGSPIYKMIQIRKFLIVEWTVKARRVWQYPAVAAVNNWNITAIKVFTYDWISGMFNDNEPQTH